MRKFEEPVITPHPSSGAPDAVKITHPAFAQITLSRTCGHAVLYGSNFDHNNYMTIRIQTSELNRDLSRDWPFARKELIEVAMSEAQWATFVSSAGIGAGVQCTLQRVNGQLVPGIPEPTNRIAQFKMEANQTLDDAKQALAKLRADIDGLKLSEKAKKELRDQVTTAERSIGSSIAFVASQFSEHVENTIEDAKAEINAYTQGAIQRAGLAALMPGAEHQPVTLSLEGQTEPVIDAETVTGD